MSEPSTKCSKCAKETADKATLCTDCAASTMDAKEEKKQNEQEKEEKTKQDCVKMEIDTDLTTTETLDDLDELDERTRQKEIVRKNQQKQTESLAKEEQQQQEKQLQLESQVKEEEQLPEESLSSLVASIKAETAAEGDAETKMAAMPSTCHAPQPTQRGGGKITRSSLNGARSPNIMKRLRKSTRSTRFKAKLTGRGGTGGGGGAGGTGAGGPTNGHNGTTNCKAHGKLGGGAAAGGGGATASTPRNRRNLFKRPAQKTPRVQATTRFVKSLFYKGSYMQIGDIVSIVDSEHNVYYAQIRGLLVDAYCEKSAFLTWLIPTQDSPDPKDGFDPATYLIGPDEELSRKLCYLEFIMHAPSNYYFDRTTPFPLPDVDEYAAQRTGGFIWTRLPIFKRDRERERERDRVGKAAA